MYSYKVTITRQCVIVNFPEALQQTVQNISFKIIWNAPVVFQIKTFLQLKFSFCLFEHSSRLKYLFLQQFVWRLTLSLSDIFSFTISFLCPLLPCTDPGHTTTADTLSITKGLTSFLKFTTKTDDLMFSSYIQFCYSLLHSFHQWFVF